VLMKSKAVASPWARYISRNHPCYPAINGGSIIQQGAIMENRQGQAETANLGELTRKTTIFYYSSTGNSLWTARALARKLGDTEVVSMVGWDKKRHLLTSRVVGLIFPVHIWGVPGRVLEFLDQLPSMGAEYIFAVANNAGQVSATLVQLAKALDSRGLTLSSGWSLVMPSNYIPWGGPGPDEKQNERLAAARSRISFIARVVRQRDHRPVEKGPLWQRIVFTWLYNLSFPHIHEMDKNFWVDERCNQCGICVRVCPAQNLVMEEGRLIWGSHCEHCLACLQWCPQEALQYGRKTPQYRRYHHPEVKLKDFMLR
jgi:ferredoxin